MKIKLLLVLFTFSMDGSLIASEVERNINFYKRVEVYDNTIHLIADLEKKTITVTKLKINEDLPIGNIKLKFEKSYVVKIRKTAISKKGEVTISGDDYYDGIGTNITLSFFVGVNNATVKIESQFEEIKLFFVPQLLKLKVN